MNRSRRLLHDSLLDYASDPALRERTAVIAEGRSHDYGELFDDASRLAASLRELGAMRGDRIAIYMDNSWLCVVSIYATLLVGGVLVLINPQTKRDKLRFMLEDSGARILLTDGHLAKEFLPAMAGIRHLPAVMCSGDVPADHDIRCLEHAIGAAEITLHETGVIPLDLAALIYTSGSTGQPKGVMQTHQSMVFALGSLIQYLRLGRDDRILCVLPLAFDYGLYQLLMAIQLGGTLVLERSFTYPAQVFSRMREFDVTVFPGVPTIFAMLLSANEREALRFEGVSRVTNTAAALPDRSATRLREIFPNALIYKMYGLTECKRVSYLEPELAEAKPGSVGKAIPGTEVYLLDADGNPTPSGQVGILHVRGPHVMLGYWNRPDLSERMLRPGRLPGERVLCTQDHFRADADGYLYFVGRSDEIIKTRGEKVSPVEVENALQAIAGIREAAVIGVPDELLGQAIRAYVVLEPGALLSSGQIRAQCIAQLENFMVPQQIVLCADLPRTVTGKISKQALLEQAQP
jgi:long-chain acyl-CoA synthetase